MPSFNRILYSSAFRPSIKSLSPNSGRHVHCHPPLFTLAADSQHLWPKASFLELISSLWLWIQKAIALRQDMHVRMTSPRFIVIEEVYSDPLAYSREEGRVGAKLWQLIS